jgi:transposase
MTETRKKYSKEFKIEAVRLYETSGKPFQEIEDDLGIGRGNLRRWKREMSEKNIRVFPGNGNPRDEEIARLKKELAIAKEERDILRKAVAIFSKPKR